MGIVGKETNAKHSSARDSSIKRKRKVPNLTHIGNNEVGEVSPTDTLFVVRWENMDTTLA